MFNFKYQLTKYLIKTHTWNKVLLYFRNCTRDRSIDKPRNRLFSPSKCCGDRCTYCKVVSFRTINFKNHAINHSVYLIKSSVADPEEISDSPPSVAETDIWLFLTFRSLNYINHTINHSGYIMKNSVAKKEPPGARLFSL